MQQESQYGGEIHSVHKNEKSCQAKIIFLWREEGRPTWIMETKKFEYERQNEMQRS